MANPAPPSAFERDQLVARRKRDLPRPSPAPAPRGMGAPTDNRLARARSDVMQREARIHDIDRALMKEKHRSMRAFERSR